MADVLAKPSGAKILAVDDEPAMREIVRRRLEMAGYRVSSAASVAEARAVIAAEGPFELVVSDINMPGERGTRLLDGLASLAPDTVCIMATAVQDAQVAVEAMRRGAYDYILKPFNMDLLLLTVGRALERRALELETRAYRTNLESLVEQRTQALHKRTLEAVGMQRSLLRAMCHMAEFRDPETGRHLERMAHYARILAVHLGKQGPYRSLVDATFIQHIFDAAPLHDLGKIGIPDAVLLKPGKHTDEERAIMQGHAMIGNVAILRVRGTLPEGVDGTFLDMAADVAAAHHERFDGAGYPAKTKGEAIPLAARIVTLADFYDACTSSRCYRPIPMPHDVVKGMILESRGLMFDPAVVDAMTATEPEFLETRDRLAD